MFGNDHFARVRQLFADQFEPEGQGFVYRKGMKGAPVRVSVAERDAFVAAFNRRLRHASWGLLPGTLVLIGVMVAFFANADGAASDIVMYAGLGLLLVAFMGAYYWAWNAPSRELAHRRTLGEPRTRAEMRQVMLARMTYGQLGLGVAAIGGALLKLSEKHDLFAGWNRLWLVGAGLVAALATFQAYRKWRFDSMRR